MNEFRILGICSFHNGLYIYISAKASQLRKNIMSKITKHGLNLRGTRYIPKSKSYFGRFGRMFRKLEPLQGWGYDQYVELSRTMVRKQKLKKEDPLRLFKDSRIPAGYTYLGQFMGHDITFDSTSDLLKQNDPDGLENFRTPRFDLDSLYGRGPKEEPYLYSDNGAKFRIERLLGEIDLTSKQNGVDAKLLAEEDIPRSIKLLNSSGEVEIEGKNDIPKKLIRSRALIGDPRNDENIIISQLHLIFLKFHNQVVDTITRKNKFSRTSPAQERFSEAQKLTRYHYQWVILKDYLPRIVSQKIIDDILVKRKYSIPNGLLSETSGTVLESNLLFYDWKVRPFIPVEFSFAAFRFGHSMIRPIYRLGDNTTPPDIPVLRLTDREDLSNELAKISQLKVKSIEGKSQKKVLNHVNAIEEQIQSLETRIEHFNKETVDLLQEIKRKTNIIRNSISESKNRKKKWTSRDNNWDEENSLKSLLTKLHCNIKSEREDRKAYLNRIKKNFKLHRVILAGFREREHNWTIDWDRFFQFNETPSNIGNAYRERCLQKDLPIQEDYGKDERPQFAQMINTDYSLGLQNLAIKSPFQSLALRDLLRGEALQLPSGQSVARAMGVPNDCILPTEIAPAGNGAETPLLYYILKEAEEIMCGEKLGPVGGRIVAEVLIGLLVGDPNSFINEDAPWTPAESIFSGQFEGDFSMADFIKIAQSKEEKQSD